MTDDGVVGSRPILTKQTPSLIRIPEEADVPRASFTLLRRETLQLLHVSGVGRVSEDLDVVANKGGNATSCVHAGRCWRCRKGRRRSRRRSCRGRRFRRVRLVPTAGTNPEREYCHARTDHQRPHRSPEPRRHFELRTLATASRRGQPSSHVVWTTPRPVRCEGLRTFLGPRRYATLQISPAGHGGQSASRLRAMPLMQ